MALNLGLLVVILAMIVSFSLVKYLIQPYAIINILDHPNHRSLHSQPIPRTGGIAIIVTILISFIGILYFVPLNFLPNLMLATVFVALIALADDRWSLPIWIRLCCHLVATLWLMGSGFRIESIEYPNGVWLLLPIVDGIITLFFVIWMLNLYNFMDGMDGFAAGMTMIGCSTLALLGYQANVNEYVIINGIIVASVLGFWGFNFPPAKIFMGDIGSSSLGFLIAALILWGHQQKLFPLWVAGLIFSPFIIDATMTLLKRVILGEKFWLPHCSHYYQRLVQLGWGHKTTVLSEYGLMLACSISAVWLTRSEADVQWWGGIVWVIVYLLLIIMVNYLEHQQD